MIEYSQRELLNLLNEGFWKTLTAPARAIGKGIGAVAKGVGGTIGAATKGIAKTLDYVAPELTNPLHRLEAGVRDIGNATRLGWDAGSGGKTKTVKDRLLDSGFIMDDEQKLTKSGKNYVAIAYKIVGHDTSGNPIPGKTPTSILIDKNYNLKVVSGQSISNNFGNMGNVNNYRSRMVPKISKKS